MGSAYPDAQVSTQKGGGQGSRPILWPRDLVGMTRMQIPGGQTACQRNRSPSQSTAQLIGVSIESIGEEKEAAGIGLIGGLF
jgi:hypothetical protein